MPHPPERGRWDVTGCVGVGCHPPHAPPSDVPPESVRHGLPGSTANLESVPAEQCNEIGNGQVIVGLDEEDVEDVAELEAPK
jgi:hypothetical protein